jgi:hypothetical protein
MIEYYEDLPEDQQREPLPIDLHGLMLRLAELRPDWWKSEDPIGHCETCLACPGYHVADATSAPHNDFCPVPRILALLEDKEGFYEQFDVVQDSDSSIPLVRLHRRFVSPWRRMS